jgi:predicted amidophosphoribosyltransferase
MRKTILFAQRKQNTCINCGKEARSSRSHYCQNCIDKILKEAVINEQRPGEQKRES